jgi:multisubunit Na+/H+ antiporter MnhG subunit
MMPDQTHSLRGIAFAAAALGVLNLLFGVWGFWRFGDQGSQAKTLFRLCFVAGFSCIIAAAIAYWAWDFWQSIVIGLIITVLGCLVWPLSKLNAIKRASGDKHQ